MSLNNELESDGRWYDVDSAGDAVYVPSWLEREIADRRASKKRTAMLKRFAFC